MYDYQDLSKVSMSQFTYDLASGNPTPGGGAAAAYTASIGVALLHKVALKLEEKIQKDPEQKEKLQEIVQIKEFLEVFIEYVELCIQDDINSYNEVTKYYKTPKAQRTDKQKRYAFASASGSALSLCVLIERLEDTINDLRSVCKNSLALDIDAAESILESAHKISSKNYDSNMAVLKKMGKMGGDSE